MKIMIIGNSHSQDTFWLLHEAFADQMPDLDVVLGVMYYSGCSVTRHVQFTNENRYVYKYHRNTDGTWKNMQSK